MDGTDGTRGRGGRRAWAAGLLAATFVAGAIAGYSVAGLRERSSAAPFRDDSGEVRFRVREGLPPAFEQLGLTVEQRAAVLEILARARPKTDTALQEMIPRLRALTDSVDAEIRAVLRPEQRERLSTIRGAREPVLLLKRAAPGGGAPRVDTLVPERRPRR